MRGAKAVTAAFAVGIVGLMLVPALAAAGMIEGKATDVSTSEPIEGVHVCAYGPAEGCTFTNASGKYSLSGLESGSYRVEFNARESGLNYITQYYNNKATFEKAIPVSVSGESTATGVDAKLKVGGQITGTVIDASTEEPIEGLDVCAFEISSEFVYCDDTDMAGEYTIVGMPTGSVYKVEFFGPGYFTQYYDAQSNWIEADSIKVVAGQTTSGIDAEMEAEPPSKSATSLNPLASDLSVPAAAIMSSGSSSTINPSQHKRFACPKGKRKVSGKLRCARKKSGRHGARRATS